MLLGGSSGGGGGDCPGHEENFGFAGAILRSTS